MIESRNLTLAVLIALIAVGVFYMLDPTLGGLMGRKTEGFYAGEVIATKAPASMNGRKADAFANPGDEDEEKVKSAEFNATPDATTVSPMTPGAEKTEGFENLSPSPMPFAAASAPANCYPKNQLAPTELLPGDANSKWAQVNPTGAGDIAGKNFLNAGALIGVNTIGNSLKNASWDLRSEPPNPQMIVSPWANSSYSPDLMRRPLEIA